MQRLFHISLWILLFTGLTSCKVSRFIFYNYADINDHKIFPVRSVEKSDSTFYFKIAKNPKVPKNIAIDGKETSFEDFIQKNKSVAFLIIQNDSIHYEQYWQDYNPSSIVPSFSVAKSITSALIGFALDDGVIQSVDEPITNYIPELRAEFEDVSIEHLLQMTSGLKFNEGYYNPFGHVATYYYGTNLRRQIPKLKLKREPGETFEYVSGNTQLLGLVLERALNGQSISSYLEEKIWKPLGMEFDASWSLDRKKDGLEKTFCCVNATARDYAKFGRLFLQKGNWNGKQLLSEDWVERSTKIDTTNGSANFYQYQWWLPTSSGDFLAQGILGQYIYVYPEKNLIIVRLGKSENDQDWQEILASLGQAY